MEKNTEKMHVWYNPERNELLDLYANPKTVNKNHLRWLDSKGYFYICKL